MLTFSPFVQFWTIMQYPSVLIINVYLRIKSDWSKNKHLQSFAAKLYCRKLSSYVYPDLNKKSVELTDLAKESLDPRIGITLFTPSRFLPVVARNLESCSCKLGGWVENTDPRSVEYPLTPLHILPYGLPHGLPYGLLNGLPYGLLHGLPYGRLHGLPYRLLNGLPYRLLYGLPYGLRGLPYRLLHGLPYGLLHGLPYGLRGLPHGLP